MKAREYALISEIVTNVKTVRYYYIPAKSEKKAYQKAKDIESPYPKEFNWEIYKKVKKGIHVQLPNMKYYPYLDGYIMKLTIK